MAPLGVELIGGVVAKPCERGREKEKRERETLIA